MSKAITIHSAKTLQTRERVREYLDQLEADHPELSHYRYAIVDVVNSNQDELVELHDYPGDQPGSGYHVLWMPEIGRAAINAYQAGDWQWTDAISPDDALRRYIDGDLAP